MNSSLRLTTREHGVTQPSPLLVRTSAWLGRESNPIVFSVPRVTVAQPPLSAASINTHMRRIFTPCHRKPIIPQPGREGNRPGASYNCTMEDCDFDAAVSSQCCVVRMTLPIETDSVRRHLSNQGGLR